MARKRRRPQISNDLNDTKSNKNNPNKSEENNEVEDTRDLFNSINEDSSDSSSDSEIQDDSDGETEKVLEDFIDDLNDFSAGKLSNESGNDNEDEASEEGNSTSGEEIDDSNEESEEYVSGNDTTEESEGSDEENETETSDQENANASAEESNNKSNEYETDSEKDNKYENNFGLSETEGESKNVVSNSKETRNGIDRKRVRHKVSTIESENKLDNSTIRNNLNTNNEYKDGDTSDEEDIRNTVGNVPIKWYDEYGHLGYDWDGNKIIKPDVGDTIDNFLKQIEDPDFWKTVKDPQTGQEVVLSNEDIELIRRIKGHKIPEPSFNEYEPWIEWFTSEVMQTPLRKFPDHKRSFLPSRDEAKKVSKLVHALKMGWIKSKKERAKEKAKKEPQFYMLWQSDDQPEEMRRIHKHIPPPKRALPGHAESYNPPPEYLFDAKELKQWNKLKETPWKRKLHFIPQKYSSLRKVPAYSRYIKERFLRCMDLYMCPRAIKMRLQVEPEELVPKLPSPKDLQPFPTMLAIEYKGHTDMVRTISSDKTGQYLVSGSDDCTIKIWEVNTGRCLKTIKTEAVIRCIEWCPNDKIPLLLVAAGNKVLLINPHMGDSLQNSKMDEILKEKPQSEIMVSDRVRTTVHWEEPTEEEYEKGYRVILTHFKEVTQVTWHGKGDYFASVMPDGQNRSVLISQISKRRSQLPFTKSKGLVQCVLFHPSKPFLFVATQRHVRIYDLIKQAMVKKLMSNSRWISNMAIHPGGDNLLVATYDRKILWFDLDLSTKPYQTLRLHGTAVRGVAFHRKYPLFASGSDDTSLIVSHGMVYNDLLKNPLIVPLKRFQDHKKDNDFGIFAVHFHPFQPWVFSSGSDSTIKLYSN